MLALLFVKYVSDKYAGQRDALIDVPAGGGFADMVALRGDKEIGEKINKIIGRLNSYKEERITNKRAHDIIIRAVDCAAITPAQIPDVLMEWRKPSHEEFVARNAFSLWNAFTEVFKTVNPHTAMRRGEALHGLFDAETGVALAS